MATAAVQKKPVARFIGNSYRTDVQTTGMDFDEMLCCFIRSRRLGVGGAKGACRERTIHEYEYDLKKFFAFLHDRKHTHWNSVTQLDIQAWVSDMQGKNLKQSSKNKMFRSVKALMKWVSLDPECDTQAMKAWLKALPKIQNNEPRMFIPTPEVMNRFHESFDHSYVWDFRDFVVVSLMLDCGARIGEICNLKAEDIKWDNNLLRLDGKTGERFVPIDSEMTVPLLKKWLRVRESVVPPQTFTPWLFLSKYGGQCKPNTFDLAFRRKRLLLGITDDLTPHTVRHFFSTHYLVNGGSLHNLKTITGHESFDTLQIYVHMANQINHVQEEHSRVSPLKSLKNTSGVNLNGTKKRKVR